MKIIVTGASSYVGKYISQYLLQYDYEVIGISRTNPGIIDKNFKFIALNLEKEEIDFPSDVLIHSAGEAKLGLLADTYFEKNILITFNIQKYIQKYKPKTIFFSTHKIYGSNTNLSINENSDIINPCNYGISKLFAERLLKDSIVLRLPSIIGVGTKGWINKLIQNLKNNNDLIIENSLYNNLIHLKDLSAFIQYIIENNIEEKCFLLSAKNKIESKELVLFIKKKINSTSTIKFVTKNTYFFDNSKMLQYYEPMDVFNSVSLYLKEIT